MHGYPTGVGEPESFKGPLGAGRWSDIMAAPVRGEEPPEGIEHDETEPPHPPPD